MNSNEIFGEPIYSYSRAQAIADGLLVDVSNVAQEAGIKFPVALTRAVWEKYVTVPPSVRCQDESGRLWDIVWMLGCAIRGQRIAGDTLFFQLFVRNTNYRSKRVSLKAVCGPGDAAEPVITVMMPSED